MILQALHDYYQRKAADPDLARRLPAYGRELKEIAFVLELAADGQLVAITDTRTMVAKKRVAARYLVPAGAKKTSGIAANLLWDNAEYVLGLPDAKKLAEAQAKGKADEYLHRLQEMRTHFRGRIASLPAAAQADAGIRAVLAFLDAAPANAVAQFADQARDIAATNPTLSFRLIDDANPDLVCQRAAIATVGGGEAELGDADPPLAPSICLITGEPAAPARLHTAVKGVWGAQTSGANIVSFNLDAFNSFGKTQGANAPVSAAAAFAYTTALNHLLDRNSRQRAQVGGASTVFWAQKDEDADVEAWLAAFIADDPDRNTEQVRALYEAVHHSARFDGARGQNRFHVLGLSPNAARISVRFWHAAPIAEIGQRIRAWFDDLAIERAPHEPAHPALRRILASACLATRERPSGDLERLPATLEGDVLRSIFDGSELPVLLVNGVLQRCRADQARKDDRTGRPVRHVSSVRAGVLKAAVNRTLRARAVTASRKELLMSLDKTNSDTPYLLGRLFAVFERVQEVAAERELNRSIRDAYFGAAMAAPRSVFPRLERLNQIHLRDVRRGRPPAARYFDRLLREINDKRDPATAYRDAVAGLRDQGIFTIGYYHQRQDFFSKNDAPSADTAGDADRDDAVPIAPAAPEAKL